MHMHMLLLLCMPMHMHATTTTMYMHMQHVHVTCTTCTCTCCLVPVRKVVRRSGAASSAPCSYSRAKETAGPCDGRPPLRMRNLLIDVGTHSSKLFLLRQGLGLLALFLCRSSGLLLAEKGSPCSLFARRRFHDRCKRLSSTPVGRSR